MWIHGDLPTHKRNKLFSNDCEFITHHGDLPTVIFLVPKLLNTISSKMSLCCCWFKGLGQCAFFDVHTNCRHKKFLLHSQPTITASFPAHYHSLIPSPLSQPHSQIIAFAVCSMVAKEMQLAVWEWDCVSLPCVSSQKQYVVWNVHILCT